MSSAETFFNQTYALFCQARAQVGAVDYQLKIGPVTVRQSFAGPAMAGKMHTAIEHLAVTVDHSIPEDAEICFWDSESTGIPMPAPPWLDTDYGPQGEIAGYNDERFRTVYSLGSDSLQLYDCERNIGIFWVPSPDRLPHWEESFPMRTLLHWWTEGKPYQLIHAGAIGTGSAGVLITGRSGSGKSTTTLSCLEAGLGYAGDDYVMVEMRAGSVPHAYSLYNTTKLINDNLEARFPQLAEWVHNTDRAEGEKALIYLHRRSPEQMSAGFPLAAILVPRYTGAIETSAQLATGASVLTAMAPSTVFNLPGKNHESFSFMVELVKQLPGYILKTGTDLKQIPEALTALVAQLEAQSEGAATPS